MRVWRFKGFCWEEKMEFLLAKDGTRIAFEKTGQGAPLVLVHGTTADHTRWAPVLEPLGERFTVYAVDRRGRGASSDTQPYAIEREFEDISALVDSIKEPVNLLGHSYGAICSLEAALLTKNLHRLILYEPPIPVGVVNVYPPQVVAALRERLAAGDRDGAITLFFQEIVHAPPQELKMLRTLPAWEGRVAAAHTTLREIDSSGNYSFYPERFKDLKVPTLLLVGGDSPLFLKKPIEVLHEALPDNRISIMPGQQHTAINTSPDLFVREVLDFLKA
jgi:pimeloyl-ACP methyl ester carboxylesterase